MLRNYTHHLLHPMTKSTFPAIILSVVFLALISCSFKKNTTPTEEQISISSTSETPANDSLWNSVTGNVTMNQIASFPSRVIVTGLNNHRLVSIYKSKLAAGVGGASGMTKLSYDNEQGGDESSEHFMPGIDILYGYNLLNIAHYDLQAEKVNLLFNHPVLVKTLYYPSVTQDSLDKQPINRDFYLMSVYDEDTNKDSLINKKDLRRFYHFDASTTVRTRLIPSDYSAIRSQYDSKNDVMYIFASHDDNKNGTQDKSEPVHIFWMSLKAPTVAKLLY